VSAQETVARYFHDMDYDATWEDVDDARRGDYMDRAANYIDQTYIRALRDEAWREGAMWAAVECGAVKAELAHWLAPTDSPYKPIT
jgi:hypothetical protein